MHCSSNWATHGSRRWGSFQRFCPLLPSGFAPFCCNLFSDAQWQYLFPLHVFAFPSTRGFERASENCVHSYAPTKKNMYGSIGSHFCCCCCRFCCTGQTQTRAKQTLGSQCVCVCARSRDGRQQGINRPRDFCRLRQFGWKTFERPFICFLLKFFPPNLPSEASAEQRGIDACRRNCCVCRRPRDELFP